MYYCDPSGYLCKWVFPKIGVPQNGWFTMENPIQMDDLGVPLFLETPKCIFGLGVSWAKKHISGRDSFRSRERTGAKVETKIQRCWAPQDVCNMDVMLKLRINAHSINLCHVYLYIFMYTYIYTYLFTIRNQPFINIPFMNGMGIIRLLDPIWHVTTEPKGLLSKSPTAVEGLIYPRCTPRKNRWVLEF